MKNFNILLKEVESLREEILNIERELLNLKSENNQLKLKISLIDSTKHDLNLKKQEEKMKKCDYEPLKTHKFDFESYFTEKIFKLYKEYFERFKNAHEEDFFADILEITKQHENFDIIVK